MVYSGGESRDSNPIIASLDSAPAKDRPPPFSLGGGSVAYGGSLSEKTMPGPSALPPFPPPLPLPGSDDLTQRESKVLPFHHQQSGTSSLNSNAIPQKAPSAGIDLRKHDPSVAVGGGSAAGGWAREKGEEGEGEAERSSEFANTTGKSAGAGRSVCLLVCPDEQNLSKGHSAGASHFTHGSSDADNKGLCKDSSTTYEKTDGESLRDDGGVGGSDVRPSPAAAAAPEREEGSCRGEVSGSGGGGEERGEGVGLEKPDLDRPVPESVEASGTLALTPTTAPAPTTTTTSSGSPQQHGPGPSPVGLLLHPITTSSLIKTSSSSLNHPASSPVPPANALSTLTLSALHHAPSLLADHPLQTKHPPPSPTPPFADVTGLGGGYASLATPPSPPPPLSRAGAERDDEYRPPPLLEPKLTGPSANTAPPPLVPPPGRPRPVNDAMGSPPAQLPLASASATPFPVRVVGMATGVTARQGIGKDLPSGWSQQHQQPRDSSSTHREDATSIEGGCTGTSHRLEGDGTIIPLAGNPGSSALTGAEVEGKQTGPLPHDTEQCFEEGTEPPPLPSGDSYSIISLGQATATGPDNTQGSSPLRGPTMPSALFKGDPLQRGSLGGALVPNGGGGGVNGMAGVSVPAAEEEEGKARPGSSVHMASVLLSQLESELTQSLHHHHHHHPSNT